MRLYHGTSGTAATLIKSQGILARKPHDVGNWPERTSSPSFVYFSNCRALHFADAATQGDDTCAIVEVELDDAVLFPTEQYLAAQSLLPAGRTTKTWTRELSDNLHLHHRYWSKCFLETGEVASLPIVPSDVTRILRLFPAQVVDLLAEYERAADKVLWQDYLFETFQTQVEVIKC